MWIQTDKHKIISASSSRLDSLQIRPIMHSECFGLFFRGKEEMMVNLGEDLEKAEGILSKIASAMADDSNFFDISAEI
jgi:hypothetical protein